MYKIYSYHLISHVYIMFKANRYNSGLIIYFGHGENIHVSEFSRFTHQFVYTRQRQSSYVSITHHHVNQQYSI